MGHINTEKSETENNMSEEIIEDEEYFEISVTEETIENCQPMSSYHCAICDALRETSHGAGEWVHVTPDSIVIDETTYKCSPELWDWQMDLINEGKKQIQPIVIGFDSITKVAQLKGEL